MSEYNKLLIEADFWKKQADRIQNKTEEKKADFEHKMEMDKIRNQGVIFDNLNEFHANNRKEDYKLKFDLNNKYRRYLSKSPIELINSIVEEEKNLFLVQQKTAYYLAYALSGLKVIFEHMHENPQIKNNKYFFYRLAHYMYDEELKAAYNYSLGNLPEAKMKYITYYFLKMKMESNMKYLDDNNQGNIKEIIYQKTQQLFFDEYKLTTNLFKKTGLELNNYFDSSSEDFRRKGIIQAEFMVTEELEKLIKGLLSNKLYRLSSYVRNYFKEENIDLSIFFMDIDLFENERKKYFNKIIHNFSDLSIINQKSMNMILSNIDYIHKINENITQVKKPSI